MIVGKPQLSDWPPYPFVEHVAAQHPAPRNPETGKPVWDHGIRLHGAQADAMKSRARYKQIRGGVRGGKSWKGAWDVYIDIEWRFGYQRIRGDLYWIVGPTYELTTPEFKHLVKMLQDAGYQFEFSNPKNAPWSIRVYDDLGECIVAAKSSQEVERIAGEAPRGIVMAEAGQQDEAAWKACQERLVETGGWLLMEGTFEAAQSWYYQMATDWEAEDAIGDTFPLPTWDNRVLFPGGRQDPKILQAELTRTPAEFMERYGGIPSKPADLVLPEADRRFHVRHRFPTLGESYDPERPVVLAVDPGRTHAYAVVACQFAGNTCWVFDTIYRWGVDVSVIVAETASRPWASNVTGIVMDLAGTQQRSEGDSNLVQWNRYWQEHQRRTIDIFAQPVPLHPGYSIHRRALLNAWPEEEAQNVWNKGGMVHRVTDPTGPRLMFAPEAAAPFFGGIVDQVPFRGEYNMHKNRRAREGAPLPEDPIKVFDDAIKALNYLLYWQFGPAYSRMEKQLIGKAIDMAMVA